MLRYQRGSPAPAAVTVQCLPSPNPYVTVSLSTLSTPPDMQSIFDDDWKGECKQEARREVTSGHSGHTLIPYSFRHPIYSIYNLMEYL